MINPLYYFPITAEELIRSIEADDKKKIRKLILRLDSNISQPSGDSAAELLYNKKDRIKHLTEVNAAALAVLAVLAGSELESLTGLNDIVFTLIWAILILLSCVCLVLIYRFQKARRTLIEYYLKDYIPVCVHLDDGVRAKCGIYGLPENRDDLPSELKSDFDDYWYAAEKISGC